MSQENESTQVIYNEGRVVGLSAWEIYKRQALGNGVPEDQIPNEHEWLSSMIGAGASMILQIPINTDAGVHDFELPATSNLSAAGVIVASPFMGDCEWSTDSMYKWATRVNSYGSLIQNDSSAAPSADGTNIPSDTYNDYQNNVIEFLKLTDGIVFTQDAKWARSSEPATLIDSGTGSKVSFSLGTSTVISITLVSEDAVPQTEGTDYTFNPATNSIVFTTAPEAGASVRVQYVRAVAEAPQKDIDPDFNRSYTVVRLYLREATTSPISILLTGFTNKRVLQGLSGHAKEDSGYAIEGSTDVSANHWDNGGMLGPEIIPWASKIIFSVPSSAFSLIGSLTRELPYKNSTTHYAGGNIGNYTITNTNGEINPNSILDFNSIQLTDYYSNHSFSDSSDPTIKEDATKVIPGSDGSCNILTAWYPGMTVDTLNTAAAADPQDTRKFFPPALYAAQVTATGVKTLVPIDTAAPGTVKAFTSSTEAYNYTQLMPYNYAIYHDTSSANTYSLVSYRENNTPATWPGLARITYDTAPKASITAGPNTAKFISLNAADNTEYDTRGDSGAVIPVGPAGYLVWDHLLNALTSDAKVDILGDRLHALGIELTPDVNGGRPKSTIGVTQDNQIDEIRSTQFTAKATDDPGSVPVGITNTISGGTSFATLDSGTSVKSGTEFIEFSNGLRLYISNTIDGPDTTNVPLGSIGIGWITSSLNEDEVITEPGELIDEHSVPANG